MQLSKRDGSPFWWVSFTDAAGKRHRTSTKETEKRAAMKVAAAMVAEADEAAPKGDTQSLYQCLESYRAQLELHGKVWAKQSALYRDKTTGNLKGDGERWHLDGKMPVHQLTPMQLQQLVEARMREGNGPVSIAHELKNIRASVRHAKVLGRRVPEILDWRIPKLPTKTRYLTTEEWQQLYDRLSPDRVIQHAPANRKAFTTVLADSTKAKMQDAQDLLVCLTFCGGRWSEVAGLRWSRINLDARVISIWGNKTQKERLAPLPDLLFEVLSRRYAQRDPAQPLVFPGKDGDVRSQSSRAIARAIEDCGLNSAQSVAQSGRCTVHSLRHTFASWLLQRGAGLADVQDALGHTTMQMTRRYAHLSKVDSTAKLTSLLSAA